MNHQEGLRRLIHDYFSFTWATWDVISGKEMVESPRRFGSNNEASRQELLNQSGQSETWNYFWPMQQYSWNAIFLLNWVINCSFNSETKCQTMHETEIISLYTSHFWTTWEWTLLKAYDPEFSCGWNGFQVPWQLKFGRKLKWILLQWWWWWWQQQHQSTTQ